MNIFYSDSISQGYCILPEIESKHAVQVLRKKTGDELVFVDGKGGYYEGIIEDAHAKRCVVRILRQTSKFGKRGYYLHLAVAPTKNIDRFEWFLEKATEIGIDRITPIYCAHSERKQVKKDRLERVIHSAMKQSLKAYLPLLDEPISFKNFLKEDYSCTKLIAHCWSDQLSPIRANLKENDHSLILIGPEGDFSEEEVQQAESKGFLSITLGNSRLRTETAAVAACHSVYFINQPV